MKSLFIFFLVLIVSNLAFSQHSHVAYLTLADSLYAHHNYQDAANYYQRALKNAKQPGNIMLKVARAYSEMNNVKDAEPWYVKAKTSNASFSNEDTYHYAKALIMLEKRKEAEVILQDLLKLDPNAFFARQLLDDLLNVGKYLKDSSGYIVTPLSINTPVAEFAPEYYKDGIVFSSAQPQFITDKKYHWDDSHFLNLYYSAKINGYNFRKPTIFDKEINTKFHDGPVAFYGNDEKMILNRNQQVKVKGKVDVSMSHLSLFDVQRNPAKKNWEFTPLPFDQPPYSFAHPSVSEDGNVLYFISDKPGGYGGTDIYRVMRIDGKWSEPFNLGPSINTSENEVFPFYIDNTLYFSSDGHGGLGGLDIWKSTQYVNGFTPAENLGYPVNSHVDDFSLITTVSGQSGYFASARTGNDDLFEFQKTPPTVKLIARAYDGLTKESLAGASIQLISIAAKDTTLVTGNGGNIQFELPTTSAYILIANKDGKKGMFSGMAVLKEDYRHVVHQIPLFGDTTAIPCIGNIQNEHGVAQNASSIEILDETTGKKTTYEKDQSLVTFLGERGHSYRVAIQNEKGDTAIHRLEIKSDETGSKTWNMVLKETPVMMTLAARVYNAETKAPLAGANVKIITLVEPDHDLTADENGIVEFSLPMDVAYIVVGAKDGLTGMHSGLVENGADKNTIVHPVPAKGDPAQPVPVVALVTNTKGELLNNAKAVITDKATGERVPGGIENGVLNFLGEHGKSYNIDVTDEGHKPTLEELSIPENAKEVEKIAVVLEEIKPASHLMAARVFKETDQSPMAGANVKIISFSEQDLDLVANDQGIVEFYIPDGAGYIVVGTKDGFTGMHMGVAEMGKDKASIVHPVPVNNDPISTLEIFGMVKNESGEPITHAEVQVTDTKTGEQVPAKIENGILSFIGKRGGNYQVAVKAENYASQLKTIPIDSSASIVEPLVINLRQKMPVVAKISNKKGEVLSDVTVTVTDKTTGEKIAAEVKNGILTFIGEQGKQYDISVEHKDHQTVVEELIIPQMAKTVDQISIALSEKALPLTASVADEAGTPVTQAEVTVIDMVTGETVESKIENGVLSFEGKRGKEYKIEAKADGYESQEKRIIIDATGSTPPNLDIKLKPVTLALKSLIADEAGNPVTNAQVVVTDNATGQKIETRIENGNLSFLGKKGGDYRIEVTADGYQPVEKQINIDPAATMPPDLDIKLLSLKSVNLALQSLIADEAGNPVTNARVVVTDNITGEKIETKIENGNLSFLGKKGGDYKIEVTADGYQPVEKRINIDPTASIPPELDIKLKAVQPVNFLMTTAIADEAGNAVTNAQVIVTDNATGEKIESKNDNGNLSFVGKKGGDYKIEVTADGFHPQQQTIAIDPNATLPPDLDIKLKSVKGVSYQMGARVFKESDNSPLENAAVKVISFAEGDIELLSDSDGQVEFMLPEGSAYIVVATTDDGYTGVHSGIVEKGTEKTSIIHPVPATKEASKQLPVFGFIADEKGDVLLNAEVEVIDVGSGEKMDVRMDNGILAYYAKKGRAYKINVKADGYKQQERNISIAANASTVEPLGIRMQRIKSVPSYLMSARIFRALDKLPLDSAEVKIMSAAEADMELLANNEGIVDFTLPEGAAYIVVATKEGYVGMHSGVVGKTTSKTSIIHPVSASKEASKELPVFGFIADENGNVLMEAEVEVTDIATGEKVNVRMENGILAYYGKKGGAYKVGVKAEGYKDQERSVNIAPNALTVQPLGIQMERVKMESFVMSARVFKEQDNSPLGGAEISVMSFPVADMELRANKNGIVDFILPEGAPYIVLGSKDGYYGIHSGVAEKGTSKTVVTHPVPTSNNAKTLPVLALVSDENGRPLSPARVVVTNKTTGQPVEAKIENGILSFIADKGGDYKIEILADDYEPQVENIKIDPNADMVRPLEITVTRKRLFVLPSASNLIIVNNETPRFYITSSENHDEIIEKDGMLYLQSKEELKAIGKGALSDLLKDPSRIIELSPEQLVTLQNIYFDYNSAFLDETDKQELNKAKLVLHRYPLLQLTVRAHADLRGSATYNMSLTRKRARSIKTYLVRQGIRSRNIFPRAFGKSAPAVLCITEECTEQQHQKNRRAEFELAALRKAKLEPVSVIKPQPIVTKPTARTRVSPNYAKILAKYGDRQLDGMVFKVCVGAYRLNPNLTFGEYADLGQVEKHLAGGINYYYLHDYATLKAAEDIRQQVIQRGISDAFIEIFYQDKKISFTKFISITEK